MKYTPFELEKMLESMIILVDTREQPGKKFKRRTETFGYPFERRKLEFGDYSCAYKDLDGRERSLAGKVAVERKMDANELAMCFTKERERFEREFQRSMEVGARIYLIVENENWEKILSGKYGSSAKYRSRLNPQAMKASMLAWACRYDIHTHFCKEETTGALIADILHYELKELLQNEE
ncbi:ERCC4 domain-containing protein [Bacilliculturomica massiliensis]|uniref:ERCC4 domain-containing protein n=1 Tax=Bacilliculturomica massiliensis TaxID=1917867 RepID=UPI001032734A|nr:ERCC4 domain-containing protein [Bacilliculturomica massiliensis]